MKATSRLSLTAFRKRMMDSAPTREKARAMFDPTIIITTATTIPLITSVNTKLCVYDVPRWVIWHIQPMKALSTKLRANTSTTSITVNSLVRS